MSTDDSVAREYQKLLLGHIQNLEGEISNLLSKLHLAKAQNNSEFGMQVERTKNAVANLQNFFGPKNPNKLLIRLAYLVDRLQAIPSDSGAIRELIQLNPQVLADGPKEGTVLEDEIKN